MEFGHYWNSIGKQYQAAYFRIQLVINAERRPSRTEQGGYKDLLNTSMGSLMILVCTEEYLDWHGCQCLNKHWIQRLSKTRMESLMVLDLASIGYKPCSLVGYMKLYFPSKVVMIIQSQSSNISVNPFMLVSQIFSQSSTNVFNSTMLLFQSGSKIMQD